MDWAPNFAAERLALAQRYAPLGVLSGIWFLAQFVRMLLPPLFSEFQSLYGVGTTETGLLFSVLMAVYALMQFPAGALSDRAWRALVITSGTVVTAVGALGMILAPSFAVLFILAAFLGLGTGTHKTVAITILSIVYPDRQARAIGTMDTIGQFGGGFAPVVLVVLSTLALSWHVAFILVAIVGGLFAFLNRRYVATALRSVDSDDDDENASAIDEHGVGVTAYLHTFRRSRFTAFVAVCVLYSFVWTGITAFLPLYLIKVKGLAPNLANLIYGILFAMAFVQVMTGDIADRYGEMVVLVGTYLGSLVGMGFFLNVRGVSATITVVVVLGLFLHGVRPARASYLVKIIPNEIAGGTLGLVRTLMSGTGAVASAVIGIAADAFGLRVAFVGVASVFGLATLLLLVVATLEWQTGATHPS